MGFLDKAKAAAEQAAARAKEGVDDVQAKRELSQAYNALGKTAFELIESGEIAHARLDAAAETIRAVTRKIADDGAEPQPADTSQPPATPT
jgi:hypothetical protein